MRKALLHQAPPLPPPCVPSLANRWQFRKRVKPGLVGSKNMSSEQQASTVPGPCKTDVDLEQEGFFQKWRANVGLCVVNSQGLVFAAQRTDTAKHTWQMPQGGIDPGEEAQAAALRELEEETSMRSVRVLASLDRWLKYNFSPEVRARLGGSWQQYEGQAQKWFLLHFYGDDSEINLETEDKEFKTWAWMPIQELAPNVVPFKRLVYEQVTADFAPIIQEMHRKGELAWKPPHQ
ncbi:NUDIX hydrolase domain-like protein [Dunaliella salina]|uniref:NUDIX hydrolase domain-like protein n=1 Tax=Dunaliella salina TaxID=3046 RepID=A0ABQ7H369_DUNSA|nr:NUDIX hydrolase domain-like protein [Dunaliella salina]|eukprot:KAF5841313.1 NUDIX hydrolase domain-like protein [Dunaliella salina]